MATLESMAKWPSYTATISFVSGVATALPLQDSRTPIGVLVEPTGLALSDSITDVKVEKASGKPTVTVTLASGGTRMLNVTIWFATSGV